MPTDELINVREAARMLHVTQDDLFHKIGQGLLDGCVRRFFRPTLIHKPELLKMLDDGVFSRRKKRAA
jgi:hypothetical protein